MEKGEEKKVVNPDEEKEPVQEEYFDSLQQFYRPTKNASASDENKENQPSLQAVEEESKQIEKSKENNKDDSEKLENKPEVREGLDAVKKVVEKKKKKPPNLKEEDPTYILQTAFQSALDKLSNASTKETVKSLKEMIL